MNENDVLFQKVTQAYSDFFPSMPVSLSGIIHHSQYLFFSQKGENIGPESNLGLGLRQSVGLYICL